MCKLPVMAKPYNHSLNTDRDQQDGPFHMKPMIGTLQSRQDSA